MAALYLEVNFEISAEFSDLIIAELDQHGYDSFQETETGVQAYILIDEFDEEVIKDLQQQYEDVVEFNYSVSELENKNWNEEWEKNFEQSIISDECIVRASFHVPDKEYKYDIVINPRMSFGTGHHATTSMMLLHELDMDIQGKKVLDAGCGTGVLAIMAAKLGASEVFAYDIDDWSYNNAVDNFSLNNTETVNISVGEVDVAIPNRPYEVILANINKNVLLQDIQHFANILQENGYLVLSGFYEKDIEDLMYEAKKHDLSLENQKEKDGWVSLRLKKNK